MLLELMSGMLLAAAPAESAAPTTGAAPEEKKICRKQVETGSLIKGKKICYTARQWQKMADDSRDEMERRASSGSASGQ